MQSRRAVRRFGLAAVASAGLGVFSPVVAAGDAEGLRRFVDKHRCEIIVRLEQIQPHAAPGKLDFYITVSVRGADDSYAQCIFNDDIGGTSVLCEAASGAYGPGRKVNMSPSRIAALAALGFDTSKPEANYSQILPTKSVEDLGKVADLLLTTLYRGYGARVSSRLKISAPLGPGGDAVRKRCVPIS
jgi:hypothetical protein